MGLTTVGCGIGEITMEAWEPVEPVMADDAGVVELTAAEFFEAEVLPIFARATTSTGAMTTACTSCHAADSYNPRQPNFLRGWPEVRDNFFTGSLVNLINLDSPESSELLTREEGHPDIWFLNGEPETVATWLELERAERGELEPPPLETECLRIPDAPSEDEGPVTGKQRLYPLGALGLPGSTFQVYVERSRAFVTLSGLNVIAGEAGVRFTKPVFIIEAEGSEPIVNESSFGHLSVAVDAGRVLSLSEEGFLSEPLPASVTGACLKVRFEEVSPLVGPGTGTSDEPEEMGAEGDRLANLCREESLSRFSSYVLPFLDSTCERCHGGGRASATATFDLTGIAMGDSASVCDTVRDRINRRSPAASALLGYFDPSGMPTHDARGLTGGEFGVLSAGVIAWLTEDE